MNQITRILSDIHFGHPASYVRNLDRLGRCWRGYPR